MVERRLGRGLSSLLGAAALESGSIPDRGAALDLPIERIRPNPHQPRQNFDAEGLEELRQSIRRHGILQPVVVRKLEDGFELIAGERRWRAARAEGLAVLPALVREGVSDEQMLELALVENVQRRDLDALEKARGYARLMRDLGWTQEQVAERVGLKRATVANHLRLLELPASVQEALAKGLVTMGHARALLALKAVNDEGLARALLARISREGLSVRQVEEAVRAAGQPRKAGGAVMGGGAMGGGGQLVPQAPWVAEIQRRLRESLSAKVSVLNRPGFSGQIVIEYHDQEDLNRLIEQLAPPRRL